MLVGAADPDAATIRIFGTDDPMHEPTEGVLLQLFGGDPDDVLDENQIAIELANILDVEGQTELELDRKKKLDFLGCRCCRYRSRIDHNRPV